MYLVDTSAWIAHFSSADSFDLRSVCPADERVICLPTYQEILEGISNESSFRRVSSILDAAPIVESPLGRELFFDAAQLYRAARKQGITVRSSADCLIAACAIRANLPVLHRDRDYSALARVSVLTEQRV